MTWTQIKQPNRKRDDKTPEAPLQGMDVIGLEQQLGQLAKELVCVRELLEERSSEEPAQEELGPIIPLEVAAKKLFQKSPKVVMHWVKKGHLTAIAMPDGKRGCSYYFNLSQLLEEMEENFTYQ